MSVDCSLRDLGFGGFLNDIEVVEHEDGCSLWAQGTFPPEEFLAAVASYESDECGLAEDELMGTDGFVLERVEHVWMVENQFTGILRRCEEFTEGAMAYTFVAR
jgi:hypothetical protein